MRIGDIIRKKRDGESLSDQEIGFFISEYNAGRIEDYHASALLMAIYINKLDERETISLTKAMAESGDYLDLENIQGIKIDKHSTGGVGDTTTLVVGPIVAALGVPFVKMSGRGLGHTGGTIDKLESIPGIDLNLDKDVFETNINKINIAISSQTGNLAPADGKIYALRDVTETVDDLSLIASSIMSKKLSIGSNGIVLDVKLGSGAFMKNIEEAVRLAEIMVSIGNSADKKTVALISNMDEPLGHAIGNNLEVIEAIQTLKGEGPDDLRDLSIALAKEILLLAQKFEDGERAEKEIKRVINNGLALEKFVEMVELQGGDGNYIKNTQLFPKARHIVPVYSRSTGYIHSINSNKIGKASLILGAGRERLDSKLDLTAGIMMNKKVDSPIEEGEVLAYIHSNKEEAIEEARDIILKAIKIGDGMKSMKKDLIFKRLE